jgi:hypothetical protein
MHVRRCANIGPRGQDTRLRMGVIGFSLTLLLAVVLAKSGAPPELRWLLALPFFLAVFGVTQALCGTCSILAVKGLRERGDGKEVILDPSELSTIRMRGRRILLASALLAVAAAGLFAELVA